MPCEFRWGQTSHKDDNIRNSSTRLKNKLGLRALFFYTRLCHRGNVIDQPSVEILLQPRELIQRIKGNENHLQKEQMNVTSKLCSRKNNIMQ